MADEIFSKVSDDIKTAMKAGEKVRLDAIRMLKAALLENKTAKAPAAELDVVTRHFKKLQDSQGLYPGDSEPFSKIAAELEVLRAYMPTALDESQLRKITAEIIGRQGKVFSAVMKEVAPQIKGRFDGKKASEIVKEMTS